MKKGIIVDLASYRKPTHPSPEESFIVSEELESAIQDLIYQLRELGPISSSN